MQCIMYACYIVSKYYIIYAYHMRYILHELCSITLRCLHAMLFSSLIISIDPYATPPTRHLKLPSAPHTSSCPSHPSCLSPPPPVPHTVTPPHAAHIPSAPHTPPSLLSENFCFEILQNKSLY